MLLNSLFRNHVVPCNIRQFLVSQRDNPHHFPSQCQACEAALSPEESIRSAARQVLDLPPPPPLIVTEHHAHTCQCHHCDAQTRAAFPEDVTSPAQYGDGIAALAAYLQTLHCIPVKRLAQLIFDTYGIRISVATLAKLIAKRAKAMEVFADAVIDQLSGEQTVVKHLDETGLRVAGKTRWIHVLCSIFLSHFRPEASRGDVPEYLLGKAMHQRLPLTFELASLATTLGVRHGLVILDAQQYHSGGCLVGGTSVKGGIVFERVLICYGPVGNISASSGLFILLDMAR